MVWGRSEISKEMSSEGTSFLPWFTGNGQKARLPSGMRDGIFSPKVIELDLGVGQEIVTGHILK